MYSKHIIAGDLSINMFQPKNGGNSHFFDLKDTYNLLNFVKLGTCLKSSNGTILDILLQRPSFLKWL